MHRIDPNSSSDQTSRSRRLRTQSTIPERILWGVLRGRNLGGFKFRRQQTIGPYIADFYCEAARLVIELDEVSHFGRLASDRSRDDYLKGRGLTVLRILNDDLLRDKAGVCEAILYRLKDLGGKDAEKGEGD